MVPNAAQYLLDFIYKTETGAARPECFEVIYGHNQAKLAKKLTSMTLDEVIASGPSRTKKFKSSAAGAAQFMRDTLVGLKKEANLDGNEVFDGDLQNELAYRLLVRRGYHDFMAGRLSVVGFGKALAQEWASFPVLADTKGKHRNVERGETYYAGDALNKALVKPETVERVLAKVKTMEDRKPEVVDPEKLDKPLGTSKTIIGWIASIIGLFFTGLKEIGFVDLNIYVQLAILAGIIGFGVYAIKRRRDIALIYRELKE